MNDSLNNDSKIKAGEQMSDSIGMLGTGTSGTGGSNMENSSKNSVSNNSTLLRGTGMESEGNNSSDGGNKGNANDDLMDTDFPGNIDDDEMKRSIYIGNVDYGTKLTELQDLFKTCGGINRITIMNDKRTGMPKGFAYLEFCEPEAVEVALKFDGAMFRGRQIKVSTKRKNIPGYNRSRGGGSFMHRGGRGGGYRGGYVRGGRYSGFNNPRGYYGHPYRGFRGGYTGGARHFANPY